MSLKNRLYRTLIRVEQVDKEFIEGIVTGWKPKQLVRFPASLIPQSILEGVQPGAYLFARVNIGAIKAEHLFFRDFEIAPSLDDDGLI